MTSSIDNLIIDTIFDIKQPITTIDELETEEYLNFHNLLDFAKEDSTLHEFFEAQASGSRPLKPLETNPQCTNTLYPIPKFMFVANMACNRPCLAADAIVVLATQPPLPKHPKKLLPMFYLDNDVSPEDHIKQFMLSLRLTDVKHEDMVCRLFSYTFIDKASTWFFSVTIE